MVRGACCVESIDGDDPPVKFREGNIVFYPHGHGHILVTRLGDRRPPELGRRSSREAISLRLPSNSSNIWRALFAVLALAPAA